MARKVVKMDVREEQQTEVIPARAKKKFTVEYKRRIVEEAAKHRQEGQVGRVGELLRREGLYSSHLARWEKAYKQGLESGLTAKTRGRKQQPANPLADKVKELQERNRKLEEKLKQAERIIEVQKKISELLEIPLSELRKS